MHWKLWRAAERTLAVVGNVLVFPGLLVHAGAEWCQEKKWESRNRAGKQLDDPDFVRSVEIE